MKLPKTNERHSKEARGFDRRRSTVASLCKICLFRDLFRGIVPSTEDISVFHTLDVVETRRHKEELSSTPSNVV